MFVKEVIVLFFSLMIGVRTAAQRLVALEGKAQGTYYIIKYVATDTSSLIYAIDSLFAAIDQSLSLYTPGSLINRFNAGNAVQMDRHMQQVITKSIAISRQTAGAFDITVKPLVDVWGFGVHRPAVQRVPDADTLRRILKYVGYRHLQVRGQLLRKRKKGVEIDCNGIAQGYTSDVIAHFLEQRGINDYLVDVGGELCGKGRNHHHKIWTVGIEQPASDEIASPVQAMIQLDGRAITTSGNYQRFFDQGGTRFAHTIDPVTGQALHSNIISVTVVAKDGITADGFDNALILMGVEKSLLFMQQHPEYGLDAYFIYKDETGKIRTQASPGFTELLIR
jgi:thiamine biosynthesis lipoprotein